MKSLNRIKIIPKFIENLSNGEIESFGIDEWFTTEEAAAFLKVSPNYLRNLTSNGQVPYFKLQRRNRYRKNDLVKLLLASRKGDCHGI